jgi:hypothetical protein
VRNRVSEERYELARSIQETLFIEKSMLRVRNRARVWRVVEGVFARIVRLREREREDGLRSCIRTKSGSTVM